MLIHLVPRIFAEGATPANAGTLTPAADGTRTHIGLVDFVSPELGLTLKGGVDLVARRPYPNKNYLVACRRTAKRTAINGILIQAPQAVPEFTTVTRWAVNAERIVTHRVRYLMLDVDLDAISEEIVLWHACCEFLGGWLSRWPAQIPMEPPVRLQPLMEVQVPTLPRVGSYTDHGDGTHLVERSETFSLPTIESGRILSSRVDARLPPLESAFHTQAHGASPGGIIP